MKLQHFIHGLGAVALGLALSPISAVAQAIAASELAEPSDQQMRQFMAAPVDIPPPATSRGFKPTAAPSAEGLCRSQTEHRGTGSQARTLVVVPYVPGVTTPHLDLPLQFPFNSDKPLLGSAQLLDKLAAMLTEPGNAHLQFAVAGHTDPSGSEPQNLKLSCARSLAAVAHLVRKGVAPERLTAYGFGSARPLEGVTAASLRRVELRRAN